VIAVRDDSYNLAPAMLATARAYILHDWTFSARSARSFRGRPSSQEWERSRLGRPCKAPIAIGSFAARPWGQSVTVEPLIWNRRFLAPPLPAPVMVIVPVAPSPPDGLQ